MIVRILGEGQVDVSEAELVRLNELDVSLKGAVDASDEIAFTAALTALHVQLRAVGTPFTGEQLQASDLVLPPVGATIEDVRELIGDDGLIEG